MDDDFNDYLGDLGHTNIDCLAVRMAIAVALEVYDRHPQSEDIRDDIRALKHVLGKDMHFPGCGDSPMRFTDDSLVDLRNEARQIVDRLLGRHRTQ